VGVSGPALRAQRAIAATERVVGTQGDGRPALPGGSAGRMRGARTGSVGPDPFILRLHRRSRLRLGIFTCGATGGYGICPGSCPGDDRDLAWDVAGELVNHNGVRGLVVRGGHELPRVGPGLGEDAALHQAEVAIDASPVAQAEPHHAIVENPGSQELDQGVPTLAGTGSASAGSGSSGAARKFLRRPCSPVSWMGTRA